MATKNILGPGVRKYSMGAQVLTTDLSMVWKRLTE